jgi:hypothetical protein
MAVHGTSTANLQASYHNFVTEDGMARRLPWEYHWFHISQSVVLGMVPVPLPLGQNRPMDGSLNIHIEDTRYKGALYLPCYY